MAPPGNVHPKALFPKAEEVGGTAGLFHLSEMWAGGDVGSQGAPQILPSLFQPTSPCSSPWTYTGRVYPGPRRPTCRRALLSMFANGGGQSGPLVCKWWLGPLCSFNDCSSLALDGRAGGEQPAEGRCRSYSMPPPASGLKARGPAWGGGSALQHLHFAGQAQPCCSLAQRHWGKALRRWTPWVSRASWVKAHPQSTAQHFQHGSGTPGVSSSKEDHEGQSPSTLSST